MFDWDDQELANIIWGEGREADDHIVPYPEDIEKKVLSDYGGNEQKTVIEENSKSEAAEKNTSTSKLIFDGSKMDENDGLSVSGVVNSELDLPSFAVSKTDDGGVAKKSQLEIDLQTSENHHEDKDLGDLVGHSWASIGSFDDLDRIFSNDDLDGTTSLGSTDELWSSPKDLISGAVTSSSVAVRSANWEFGALGNTSANIEINSEYLPNGNPDATTCCQKEDGISPFSRRSIGRHVEQEEYASVATDLVEEKVGFGISGKTAIGSHVFAQDAASPIKSTDKETDRTADSRLMRDVYGTWPSSAASVPQFGHQCASAAEPYYPASIPGQQSLSQDYRPMPYPNYSTPYGAPYAYGNFTNQYPTMRMPKPMEDEHQSILSGSEANPGDLILNKPVNIAKNPTKMTPQQKIEKLRRRQQMRALLAIQKQQQQLGHQASSRDYPHTHKSLQENHVQLMEKSDLEADEFLSILPCYDPGSPNKGDDSSTISNIDDCAVEDTVLYQLQDIISRMDMKIRLCIRDSLYRLAHSATQRHYASDTSTKKWSRSYAPDIAKEEASSHDRCLGNANLETETNHRDRAVAHLLFHRPLNLSIRHAETPESSTSTKVSTEQETATPSSMSVDLLARSSENEYNLSPHKSKGLLEMLDSQDESTSNNVSRKEMKISPQMKQMMAEHAG